ncbi:hypothetical protein L1987_25222 [Smallanthus sonchifolius]|uniref:Uncharacterized protein n=1 Tax=Smallanthus sonchifolius TaxID=185202 RepID=A0ACB9IP42_9ASTR|nr:hypothetical protein L1987_25222 [Smallanthus sonchifolius]
MLNDEKLLEESIKVHETQEAPNRSEEASIVKRKQAQALMEGADLAIYRATMALRIAEAITVPQPWVLISSQEKASVENLHVFAMVMQLLMLSPLNCHVSLDWVSNAEEQRYYVTPLLLL